MSRRHVRRKIFHPGWDDVAKDAARERVKLKLERRRDHDWPIRDLEYRLEADALPANLAAPRQLARLANLTDGVEILGLEAALVVVRYERLVTALDIELAQLAVVLKCAILPRYHGTFGQGSAITIQCLQCHLAVGWLSWRMGSHIGVLDDLVDDPRTRRVDLTRERAEAVHDRLLVLLPAR